MSAPPPVNLKTLPRRPGITSPAPPFHHATGSSSGGSTADIPPPPSFDDNIPPPPPATAGGWSRPLPPVFSAPAVAPPQLVQPLPSRQSSLRTSPSLPRQHSSSPPPPPPPQASSSPSSSPTPKLPCGPLQLDDADVARLAIEMEETLVLALEDIQNNFHAPLLQRLGKLAAADLDVVFKEVEQLLGVSKDLVKRMRETASMATGAPFWLALQYGASLSYWPTYKRFLTTHLDSLAKFHSLQTNQPFVFALLSCSSQHFPGLQLLDLFWMISSRLELIVRLARAQRAHKQSNEQLQLTTQAIHSYLSRGRECSECYGGSKSGEMGASLTSTAITQISMDEWETVDKAISQLVDMQAAASHMEELHGGLGLVRQILDTRKLIPPSTTRKLLQKFDVALQTKSPCGLSTEVPSTLMFFSDGVALCLPHSAPPVPGRNLKYRIVEWYKQSQVMLTDPPQDPTARRFFTFSIASRLPPAAAASAPLPPGWEEITKGGKHTYTNKTVGVTQTQRPEGVDIADQLHNLVARTQEIKSACLTRARELGGDTAVVIAGEVKQPPYLMIGCTLQALMQHEQSLYPGAKVPLLARKILHHIISHGLGEEGIFRLSGEKQKIEDLRAMVNSGKLNDINFSSYNIDLVSGLFKMFLRDMAPPLIPAELYDGFLAIPAMAEDKQIPAIAALVKKLPTANYALLRELLSFLYQIACNEHVNSMNSKNLAIVTSPNILRKDSQKENVTLMTAANDVVATMIDHFLELFEDDDSTSHSETEDALISQQEEWVTFRRKLLGHERSVPVLLRSHEGDKIWSLDLDGNVFVWSASLARLVERKRWDIKIPLCGCLVGTNFWIGTPNGVFIYDDSTGSLVSSTTGVVCMSLLVISGDEVWCGTDGKIIIFSASKLQPIAEIPLESPSINVTCMTVIGNHVWSGTMGRGRQFQEINIWERHSHVLVDTIFAHKRKITALSVHNTSDPANATVWSCSEDSTIGVWSAIRHTRLATLDRHKGYVHSLCVLPDQIWSCSADKAIMIWDPHTFHYLGQITGYHTDTVSILLPCRQRDGTHDVWSGSNDKSVIAWRVKAAPKVN